MYNIGDKLTETQYTNEVRNWLNEKQYYLKDIDDGEYVYQVAEVPPLTVEEQQMILRMRRTSECFSIVNRGAPWYDSLTTEQKSELTLWYQAWLNAPQTLTAPPKPEWIK